MDKKDIQVLYVVGVGRSGSTIFDIVLGSSPHVQGVGELTYIFSEGFIKGEKCSCGLIPDECDFFSKVRDRYYEITGDCSYEAYENVRDKVERLWKLPFLLFGLIPPKTIRDYQEKTEAMYQAISDVSGKTIILDSSKRPGRLAALSHCKNINIVPIHLVRDGRGYIWSTMKQQKRIGFESGEVLSRRKHLLESIGVWSLVNLASLTSLAYLKLKKQGKRKMVLRYDHFCKDPSIAIAKISNFLELDDLKMGIKLDGNMPFSPGHKIGGNMTKYVEILKVRHDEDWKENLGLFYKVVYFLLAWPLHIIYRFHR